MSSKKQKDRPVILPYPELLDEGATCEMKLNAYQRRLHAALALLHVLAEANGKLREELEEAQSRTHTGF